MLEVSCSLLLTWMEYVSVLLLCVDHAASSSQSREANTSKNNKNPTERQLHQQHHNNVVSRVQFCELRVSPASNDALRCWRVRHREIRL